MIETVTEALLYSTVKTRAGFYRPVVEMYDGKQMTWRETHSPHPTREDALRAAQELCHAHSSGAYVSARTSLHGKRLRRRGNFTVWLASLSAT